MLMERTETKPLEAAPVLEVRRLKKHFPLQEKGLLRRRIGAHQGGG